MNNHLRGLAIHALLPHTIRPRSICVLMVKSEHPAGLHHSMTAQLICFLFKRQVCERLHGSIWPKWSHVHGRRLRMAELKTLIISRSLFEKIKYFVLRGLIWVMTITQMFLRCTVGLRQGFIKFYVSCFLSTRQLVTPSTFSFSYGLFENRVYFTNESPPTFMSSYILGGWSHNCLWNTNVLMGFCLSCLAVRQTTCCAVMDRYSNIRLLIDSLHLLRILIM